MRLRSAGVECDGSRDVVLLLRGDDRGEGVDDRCEGVDGRFDGVDGDGEDVGSVPGVLVLVPGLVSGLDP